MNMRAGAAKSASTWLTSLARDVRGNTMAMVAAAIIPLAGMVGGGVDISRMYIVKTRLQHACDAGALAGRKQMGGGTWSYNSYAAQGAANRFFDANIQESPYGAVTVTRAFTESAGKVSGAASATVPMTIMRVFGRNNETLNVTCDAEMRLPNTDVMFVLDTTGSMANKAVSTDSQTKIQALKSAVKCFYEIVARLDTAETCATGAPSGGTGGTVQIRFGFVPYATNVNVGRLLKPEWMPDSWSYQSRKLANTPSGSWGTWSSQQTTSCSNIPDDTEDRQYIIDSQRWGNCTYRTRAWTGTAARWNYALVSQPIIGLKNGTSWNTSMTLPIGASGSQQSISWDGCIEERKTVKQSSYIPIPADAKDLDIDLVPNSDETRWGPALPEVIYTRNTAPRSGTDSSYYSRTAVSNTTAIYSNEAYYACPTEARKLQPWPTASAFESYVDGLTTEGNTYHDIGLLWGARLMSPTGLFRSENEFTSQGAEIERHLIFMTDGEACTGVNNYTAYGVPWWDRRQTADNTAPTEGCMTTGTLTQQVNARTAAICAAVRNKNITLWVIWFGASNSTIEGMLSSCATPSRFFTARNSTDLQNTFKSIADQISQLRLTR